VSVSDQRVVEGVLGRELRLLADRVRADADALRADLAELGSEVAEVATLDRAAIRQRCRIEEQHDRTLAEEVRQPERLPLVVDGLEVVIDVAGLQHHGLLWDVAQSSQIGLAEATEVRPNDGFPGFSVVPRRANDAGSREVKSR